MCRKKQTGSDTVDEDVYTVASQDPVQLFLAFLIGCSAVREYAFQLHCRRFGQIEAICADGSNTARA